MSSPARAPARPSARPASPRTRPATRRLRPASQRQPAKRARKASRAAAKPKARRALWSRGLLVVLALATSVVIVVVLGGPSIGVAFEQRAEIRQAEILAQQLDAQIDAYTAEIEARSGAAGARREALCYGPYVEPGTEVYSVLGVSGCVNWDRTSP